MAYYSRKIETPATMADGLRNFVQMIINRIEAGEHHEALLTAVDLLDTLSGKSNPYASVTDESIKFQRMIADLTATHQRDLAAAIKQAMDDGIAEGRRLQKQDTAKALGLI